MKSNYFHIWKGRTGKIRYRLRGRAIKPFRILKLIAIACLMASGFNANANVDGSRFTPANQICEVRWNSTEHCFEFTVLIQDDWGEGRNEWIETAKVYIDGTNVFDIGGPPANATLCRPNETSYVRIRWQSSHSSGKPFIRAQGVSTSTTNCQSAWDTSPYTDYYIGDYSANHYFQCSEIPAYPSHDANSGLHQYARFRFYPAKALASGTTITVELRNITIIEEISGQTKTLSNVSKSATVSSMPAAPSAQSITDGTIQSGGEHRFVTGASGATAFLLKKGSSVLETKTGSSATFTGKYITSEPEFLNGVSFGFNLQKEYGSDNKTITYQWQSSQTLTSQRTGVFTGNLNASLEACGKVKLTWQIKNPSTTAGVNTQGFTLEVKKGEEGWTAVSSGIPSYSAQSGGTGDYTYTYTIPDGDLNRGTVNYQFRVKRAFADWDDAELKAVFQRNTTMSVNTDFKQLTGIEMRPAKDSYPRLTWNMTTDGFECTNNITLKLKVAGTETNIPKDSILRGGYQSSFDNGILDCSPQRYELVLQYGTLPAITYTVNANYIYEPTGKREFEKIVVSKGYYSDRNNIKWYLRSGYDEFTRFRLMRKEAGQPDEEYISVGNEITHTRGALQYTRDDNEINAGAYYIYKVEGIYECSGDPGSLSSPESVGFSQPYGSVSGRVTYTGSQAVQNVEIKVITDNALNSNRELEFNRTRTNSLVSIPAGTRLFSRDGFSFEAYVKFSESQNDTLLSNSLLSIARGTDNRFSLKIKGVTATVPAATVNGEYTHLALTLERQGNYRNYRIKVYLGDTLAHTADVTLSADAVTPTAPTKIGEAFSGYLDDVRIWNRVLTAEEIALNYDRVLGGNEDGLAAYYKFDEIDIAESALFDCSAVGMAFNGNHAEKGAGVNRANVPVSASHIGIKGVTDANGNYSIINSIPYTSEGTTYYLSPSLGIHQFDPNNQPLYFSPDSKVFNSVNFTDISSFPVSGQVLYSGSNYPVEGVMIYVDGVVANKDGKIIETDIEGKFTVDVPIGEHSVSLAKQGHVFVDGGRFPANALQKYNFQTSVNGLIFTDVTTVRIIGRVAGGDLQTEKRLGFGFSKANIGRATVRLATVNDLYRLNLTGADSIVDGNIIGIKGQTSKTTFKNPVSGSIIEIETNPETGEFLAVLPPVPYSITGIKTKDFEDTFVDGDERDFECSKMVFDVNPATEYTAEYTDTTNTKHEFVYHDSLKITHYAEPVIKVADLRAAEGAFGDSIFVYRNVALNISDTVRLYTVQAGGTVNYTFGYPLFSQKQSQYRWKISVMEEYLNHDDEANPQTDIVPLSGRTISIDNALASQEAEFEYDEFTQRAGDEISMTSSKSEIILDAEGMHRFQFNVGFPKLGGDHLLAVKLSLDHNGKEIVWNNGQSAGQEFKGYLLGQVISDGNNFITKGPDAVDIILPDPPGSYSYSYIEKGTSITKTHSHKFSFEVSEIEEGTIHAGFTVSMSAGSPVFHIKEEEAIIAELGETAGGKQTRGEGNTTETTYTFNERLSTSGDLAFVGSDADVYIGRAQNRLFGMVRQLALYPTADDNTGSTIISGNYSMFPKEITAVGDEFATFFSYTQSYVVNTLIPNTKQLRNGLIRHVDGELPPVTNNSLTFADDDGSPIDVIYLSNLDVNDPRFGEENTYQVYFNPNSSGTRADEVQAYNNWIAGWEKTISDNEAAKIAMFDNRAELEGKELMYNRSFNAGVNISESMTNEYKFTEAYDSTKVFLGSFSAKGGYLHNETTGIEVKFTVERENTWEDNWEESKSSTVTFGYELSEDGGDYLKGVNDAITVDVYKPVIKEMEEILDKGEFKSPVKTLRGYTFRTRAGQTSCPFEPADSTLYYKKSGSLQLLNYGTFQIEKPDLYINSSKTASAENIPAGREATFEVQMNNMSDTKDDVTYQLSVGDYSNLNGLILSIDGTPLTEPREYTVEYGEELVKTLKVRQSSQDILEYEDVELVLSSTCDDSELTASSATLSVKFIASSSPVTLRSNTRLANIEGLNGGGKIRFTVSDYEPGYRNFGCIRLEYRSVANENWTVLRTYVNDESLYPIDSDDREAIGGQASLAYDYTYSATVPSDGEYIFRAVSVSKIGTEEITYESEEIRVVKDTKAPQALGYPSPVNGILNAGDEISVTFNEEIQSGKLVDGVIGSNFKITGILNGDIREEPTSGASFSGSQSAYTEMPVYVSGSFSIETWFKRTNNTAGTLFAYGSGNDYISLGFDATGHVAVTIGDESYTSTGAIDNADDTWKYIGMAYDRETGTVSVNEYQGTQTLRLFESKTFAKVPATQGKLYLGNTAGGNSGFNGAVALLHFYNFARSEAQMSTTKSLSKSGTETGLIGLWELEDDEGALAKDKARARHLTLNNTGRYIYPVGKSPAFDGVSQYARIASGTFPFGVYDDFTLEFWFKGNAQDAATLLSIGTETHIGFDAESRLTLKTGNNTQILAPAGLLDGKWRHFALSVKRNGSARASIDGLATASFNSSFFGEVGGEYYHLGTKYTRVVGNTYAYSEYFAGNIDELRVWNSALTAEAILYNKNYSLRGDEAGLKAYYPFEITQQVNGSIYSVNSSLADVISAGSLEPKTASLFGGASTGDVSAPLQLARPVKNVPYTFTASSSKIVLNLTEEEYRIDGVTLSISVENVLDMHDNTSGAINWIAYVNRNALNWNTDLVDIIMENGEGRTFKAAISNSSGEKKDYFIEDLPSWLTVDAPQGTLNPLSTRELTFTVAAGANIGAYEASVALTGTNSVKKILPVSLRVTGERPDWTVNPADYEQSMTVVGQLQINGLPQEDPEDLIAAFVGNTCVGLVSPTYEAAYQNYLVYMQVWGNASDNGSSIVFKIWDASTGNIYPLIETLENGNPVQLQYAGNSLKGTPTVPVRFNALDAIEQSMLLNTGWNWISFNIDSPSLADVNSLMNGIANGSEIKGLTSFSHYDAGNSLWTNGTMNGEGLLNTRMYMLKMSGANTLALPGAPLSADNISISLYSGWNWISYIPQVNETVSEAFAGANPQNGDLVKSQTAFSVYDSKVGWVGTLDYMRPGQGYMYNTGMQRSFKYPKTGIMTRSIEGDPILDDDRNTTEPLTLNRPYPSLNGEIAPNFESSLSLIGEVQISSDVLSESARLIAVVNGEYRGIAEASRVGDRYLFFLPVYSSSQNEAVTFVLENSGKKIPLRENVSYRPNAVLGTLESPVLLTDANINLKVYPNPFIDRMTASFEIEKRNAKVRVELVSMAGAVIYTKTYTIASPGAQHLDIDGSTVGGLTEGKYIIRVTLDDKETFTNIIIKGTY